MIAANSAVALGYAGGLVATPATAENWLITPSVSVTETYTTNANLAPSGQAQSSFVTSAAASVAVAGNGARVQLNGFATLQGLVYVGDFQQEQLYPQANLIGNVEAVEKFFYIEGAVNVSQQYLSAFGPQTTGNIGVTDNRYTTAGFRLSPYIKGVLPGEITYLLRNDNIWSNLGNNQSLPGATASYVTSWTGRVESPIRTFGWTIEGITTSTTFTDESSLTNDIVRGYLNYRPDPQVLLYAIAGYEWNDYFLTESNNAVYGVGGEWKPTDRTNIRGNVQNRFFGTEYLAAVTHRNPFSAFDVNASRNITSYPQQLFAAPDGGGVAALVDASFVTRIPDPVARAQAVQAFLAASGLSTSLQTPVNFYTQQVILYDQQSATFTLLGVRNSTAFTLYNRKSEAISGGSGVALPTLLSGQNNNTQRGGAITFSHRLTPLTNLSATYTRYQTTSTPPLVGRTTGDTVLVGVDTRLGPNTNGFTGMTYSDVASNVSNDYTVFTVYVGLTHRF
jgi:uncharacterized protein (PEP-CTERM system associated)